MKWLKMKFQGVLIAVLLIMLSSPVFAGTTYDKDVSAVERPGKLFYYGTVTFTDSASGAIYYTQAFYIGATNVSYAMGRFVCSEAGTEDVNLFVEYSMDAENWVAGTTDADLDAVGTTAKIDTIGIVESSVQLLYRTWLFMRYKFVAGQNMNAATLSWGTAFIKPAGIEDLRLQLVKDTQ